MKNRLNGLKIALCQMKVSPGKPDLNVAYIVEEIEKAAKRGVDLIVFPELCVTGYFIGDLFEDEAFLRDVERLNKNIREATKVGIAAVVGTTVVTPNEKGEDGRQRVLNAAVVYANGRYVGHAAKTLQPNYRMFDDDRHFFSTRKIALEGEKLPNELLQPFKINLKNGRELNLGVILCEDMWHGDYPINPTKILTERGAELVCNLSASPWTWQKNRKRHQVVKEIVDGCRTPFVYVNNTGVQNTGKNLMIFDGASTVYDEAGRIVHEIGPYKDGTEDFVFRYPLTTLSPAAQDDTRELYLAMRSAIKEFFAAQPPRKRKVVIGISGGIDSALSAGLYADALGPDKVFGINMPSKFNSDLTKSLAKRLAENLGIVYEVRPIQGIVDAIAAASGVRENTLAYENIQARSRMEVLAARAQDLDGFFIANWNKIEAAFGYGTLYGDMAGALATIGDLVKREVYQLADYLNRKVFKREAIPQGTFDIVPTAELRVNQKDPFDYGTLKCRGYHEEVVRAFIEFRRNPEWLLDLYDRGLLESELKLEPGRLKGLFPTNRQYIHDLEKHWKMFCRAYFKRIQGPPIPIVSKRAFGMDLRESLLPHYFTERYLELKAKLLAKDPVRIAVYGGSFNPPALHHRQLVSQLLVWFNEVAVVPCGIRDAKPSLKEATLAQRKEMSRLNFGDFARAALDFYDLENNVFTPTWALAERYRKQFSDRQIWLVVGADLIVGGKDGQSEIQRSWINGEEIWKSLNFTVTTRPGFNFTPDDLPPNSEVIEAEEVPGSSTLIRDLVAQGKDASGLVKKEVLDYIKRENIYGGGAC